MKKILFVNGHMKTGGIEKSLLDLLKHIDKNEYIVDLLLFEEIGDYKNDIPNNINIIYKDINNTFGSIFDVIKKCIKKEIGKLL